MAKVFEIAALVATALCFSSLLSFSSAKNSSNNEKFYVQGLVYCDTCRVEMETNLSKPLQGVKAVLECKEGENVTYSREAVTDYKGMYNITVEGDHGKETCLINLRDSPDSDCSEKFNLPFARILLTNDVGVTEAVRQAKPLGFKKKEALAECSNVLKEMGVNPHALRH